MTRLRMLPTSLLGASRALGLHLTIGLAIALSCADAHAQATRDPGLQAKRQAIVFGVLGAAFGGAGAALLVTQPSDGFSWGAGLGLAAWGAGLGVDALSSATAMAAARRRANDSAAQPPPRPVTRRSILRLYRWNVGLAASSAGLGVAAIGVERAVDGEARSLSGMGAVYAFVGTAYTIWTGWALCDVKRRFRAWQRQRQHAAPKVALTLSPFGLGGRF